MTPETPAAPREDRRWFDAPRNIDRIVWAVCFLCAVLLAADIFVAKHGPFAIEHLFGFYGVFSFAACTALVLAARALRAAVKRPEGYYDR